MGRGTGESVLIIDDRRDLRQVLGSLLEAAGYATQTAANGIGALEAIRTRRPDVILLDWQLDDQPAGAELLGLLRGACGHIPIVVMSAHLDVAGRALDGGADAFLGKPFRPGRLLALLAEQLAR